MVLYNLLASVRGSSAFTPLTLSPALWLDANDPATVYQDSALTTMATADGDPVGGWKDKSGNDRHLTQATGSKRPTLKTAGNGQNGLPLVLADGVDDYLASASFTLAQPFMFYVAYKCPDTGIKGIWSDVANNVGFRHRDGAGAYIVHVGTQNFFPSLGGSFLIASGLIQENNTALWKNGVAQSGGGGTGTAGISTGLRLFNVFLDLFPSNAQIGEVLFYGASHTAGERAQVETYLNAKWAVY